MNGCSSLRKILIHPDNRNFVSDKTGLFSPDRKILYAAFSPDSEVYHVPDGVTFIYQAAFCVNQHFRFIFLPESLRSIGLAAFACAGCLEEISLPDQITDIEDVIGQVLDAHRLVFIRDKRRIVIDTDDASVLFQCLEHIIRHIPDMRTQCPRAGM